MSIFCLHTIAGNSKMFSQQLRSLHLNVNFANKQKYKNIFCIYIYKIYFWNISTPKWIASEWAAVNLYDKNIRLISKTSILMSMQTIIYFTKATGSFPSTHYLFRTRNQEKKFVVAETFTTQMCSCTTYAYSFTTKFPTC